MSFKQLLCATKILLDRYPFFALTLEWETKRNHLVVYIQDLPNLVEECKKRNRHLYAADSRIIIAEEIPRIRLASACEATTNTLYAMAEISAQFGNKASRGNLPASFNAIRKGIETGKYDSLAQRLGDLQWYRKVREIRTEWVHFSSIFIRERNGEPVMVVRALRRPSDQQEFSSDILTTIPNLINWIEGAINTVDAFGDYLVKEYLVPGFPLDERLQIHKLDRNGLPIILANGFDTEEITVREYLGRCDLPVSQE